MSYQVNCSIIGTTPILQHKFGADVLDDLMQGATRKSGKEDYRYEWMKTMYVSRQGYLFQPSSHLEGAMTQAGVLFSVKGRGKKTYKDSVKAYISVSPAEVLHYWEGEPVVSPDESLLLNPTEHLEVSIMRAKIQRAAITRLRLQINAGWELRFTISVKDDQFQMDVLRAILDEAGHAIGIGDYRPKYGQFRVDCFDVV